MRLFTLLLALFGSGSACHFPDFMQTNTTNSSGEWRTGIHTQNTAFAASVTVSGGTMVTESKDGESHTRVCLADHGDDAYLVAHESVGGQNGLQFVCVQFVSRGSGVAQIRLSPTSGSMDGVDCANTTTNPWLLIDEGRLQRGVCRPSLRGGFSMWIYDSGRGHGICDGYKGETSLESECRADDGVQLNFRVHGCVPPDMYMHTVQDTSCAAKWLEGSFEYLLLRHPTLKYMWLLRYYAQDVTADSLTVFLLKDLFVDTNPKVSDRTGYLQLDMVRNPTRPVTSLCVDEYDLCRTWNEPCAAGPETALSCQRTCGICNSTRPRPCSLRQSWQGKWLSGDTGGITVNETFLTVHGVKDERFHCIDWGDSVDDGRGNGAAQMLVSEFDGGCRTQYTCAQFLQKSPSLLFFKLSTSRRWPFVRRPDDPLTCEQFTFSDPTPPRLYRSNLLHIFHASTPSTVSCGLPRDLSVLAVLTRNGTRCEAGLVVSAHGSDMRLESDACRGQLDGRLLSCLESSRLLPGRDQVIVTRTFGRPDELLCWLFPKKNARVVYVLTAAECHDGAARLLRQRRLQPLATLRTRATLSALPSHPPPSPSRTSRPATPARTTPVYRVVEREVTINNATATSIITDYYRKPFVILIILVMFASIQIPCLAKYC